MENLPTRNNNPGDLRGGSGSFQQFSSPQEGYAALLNDLHAKQTGTTSTGLGPNSTLADFAKTYAPPSDNNDSAKYAADLANQMGVSPVTPLKDLDLGKWADAVSKNEGYQGYNPKPFSKPGGENQEPRTSPGEFNFSDVPVATPKPKPSIGNIGQGALNVLNAAEKPFIGLAAAPFQGIARALGQPDPYAQGIGGGKPGVQVDPLAQKAGGIVEQQLGNAAQVGSYFVPGGEGLLPTIAGGAVSGLLQGAGSAMSKGKNATEVATQGAEGGLLGGGIAGGLSLGGGLLKKAGESISGEGQAKAIQELKNAYGSALNLNASERGFESRSGKDLAQILTDNRVPLGRYDNGTLDASGAIDQLQAKLNTLNDQAAPMIQVADQKGDLVSLPHILDQAKQEIQGLNISASEKKAALQSATQQMLDEMELHGELVKPSLAEEIKQGLQATAFKKSRLPVPEAATQSDVAYVLSKKLRSNLEDIVQSTVAGKDYGALNAQRSDLVDAIKRLTKLDGVRLVKGERLGKAAGQIIGTIVGASHGNPLTAMAGDYFGGKAAEFLSNPATKIGIASAKANVAGIPSRLSGAVGKPVGKALSKTGTALSRSARPAGLLANLIANAK